MADENDEALKAAQGVADKVLRRAAIYNNHPQTTEMEVSAFIPIFIAPYAVTVEKIAFVLSDTVPSNHENAATLTLYKGETVIASLDSQGGWPAFMVMTETISGVDLAENDALYLSIGKLGGGVVLPSLHFAVTYVQK